MAIIGLVALSSYAESEADALRARAKKYFEPLPKKMPGVENDTYTLMSLGRTLYFDKSLSAKKDISCNSCHSLTEGGTYERKVDVKHGERDSPTVFNAGLHFAQFWDGRASDLEGQARAPMLNPEEMGLPDEAELLKRLNADYSYRVHFSRAFPGQTNPITIDNTARAIAAFERTAITHDRFDDFLKGRDSALSRAERKGLALFLDTGCQKCHDGPLLGGNSFQKIGVMHPYANTNDIGRAKITGDATDCFKFKTPSLRNVTLTPPYFHDGKVATLSEAVTLMAHLQLDKELSPEEARSIATFLHTLAGRRQVLAGGTSKFSP